MKTLVGILSMVVLAGCSTYSHQDYMSGSRKTEKLLQAVIKCKTDVDAKKRAAKNAVRVHTEALLSDSYIRDAYAEKYQQETLAKKAKAEAELASYQTPDTCMADARAAVPFTDAEREAMQSAPQYSGGYTPAPRYWTPRTYTRCTHYDSSYTTCVTQ